MSGWVCQWKPFWIPVGDSFQKAYLEEWIHMGDDSSRTLGKQCMASIPTMVQGAEYKDCTPYKKDLKKHLRHRDRHGRQVENMIRLFGSYLEPRVRHPSGRAEAPLPPPRPRCNFIHPKQLSPFTERLKLPVFK